MKGKALIFASLCAILLLSCGRRKPAAPADGKTPEAPAAFPFVEIPAIMTEGAQRLEYYAAHFWDRFLDTSAVRSDVPQENLESAVGFYATTLGELPLATARKDISSLCDKLEALKEKDASTSVPDSVIKLIDKYLFDPNSPVRNEDIYGTFAGRLETSAITPDSLRMHYGRTARLCRLNEAGTPAADFKFTSPNGKVSSLYGVQAPLTLLFFSNPGCTACKEITEALSQDAMVSSMIADGALAVVNIYIDSDLDAWRKYAGTYPAAWHTGYDHLSAIREKLLYNVRAIPSLYLLDADKKVIMKDAPTERVISYLNN